METGDLFDGRLLPSDVSLGDDLTLRPLRVDDMTPEYVALLNELSPSSLPPVPMDEYKKQFALLQRDKLTYTVVIASKELNRVVATATLLVERKLVRGCALAGHVEDVVIASDHRSRGLGRVMIKTLEHMARKLECYKIILDCMDHNQGFYEKCGFFRQGLEMKMRL